MNEYLNELKRLDIESKALLKELINLETNMESIDYFLDNIHSLSDRTSKTLDLYKRIVNSENL